MAAHPEDSVVRSGRREAAFALAMWLVAMVVTVTTCYRSGYGRSLDMVTYILWFPDWVFWGLIVPWLACIAVSMIFAMRFMQDAALEDEPTDDAAAEEISRA